MAAGDATWNPKKGVAYRVTFPILDADGDLVTGATGLDSEVSKDAGTFADCTNEATEIATSSGVYYLDLTAAEMNADTVSVIVKTTSSGAKTTVLVMYPLETADMPVDVLAISGDSVAADNLESAADGTGYNLGGGSVVAASVTGSVGSVTGAVGSVTGAVGSVTGNVGGNVMGSVASVTARVTANTDQLAGQTVTAAAGVTFPTSVASPTNITGGTLTTVGTVTNAVTVGTNNDKTGYSLTQAFPSNFAALGINASGHISRVTLVDTTTTNTDMRGTDNAALASAWTATRAGYLDSVLIAANSNQRTVNVTGSNHVAADMHESQVGSIHATTFDAGAIDAAALASDAATEIATAVLTTSMTESYRAAGVAPTLAQAAFELVAHMGDSAISGTTKTLRKIDGTTAKTFTLDSATVPTSITETT
jgi:hypothetical protein